MADARVKRCKIRHFTLSVRVFRIVACKMPSCKGRHAFQCDDHDGFGTKKQC